MWKKLYAWLDERLGLNDLYNATCSTAPNPSATGGTPSARPACSCSSCRVLTGIFLTVYYTPSPDHAYDSVQ